MKKFTKLLALLLILAMSLTLVVACDNKDKDKEDEDSTPTVNTNPTEAKDNLKANGYDVELVDDPDYLGYFGVENLEAVIYAEKGMEDETGDGIYIFYFKDSDAADAAYDTLKAEFDEMSAAEGAPKNLIVDKSGKVIWYGTEAAIKATKSSSGTPTPDSTTKEPNSAIPGPDIDGDLNTNPTSARAALESAGYIAVLVNDATTIDAMGIEGLTSYMYAVKDSTGDAIYLYYFTNAAAATSSYPVFEIAVGELSASFSAEFVLVKSDNVICMGTEAAINASK